MHVRHRHRGCFPNYITVVERERFVCFGCFSGISSEAPGQDEHKEVVSGDGEAEKKAIAISTLFFTLLILGKQCDDTFVCFNLHSQRTFVVRLKIGWAKNVFSPTFLLQLYKIMK